MKKNTATNNTEVVITEKEDPNSPASLIKMAVEKGAHVDQIEKLIGLQERWERNIAQKEFNLAMAKFQSECPAINKKKIVRDKGGKEIYRYAPLGDIIEQTKKPIADNGLFYDFTTEQTKETLKVICTVTHSRGFSKNTDFTIPIGNEAYMTDVQKYGARMTFAKRYAFCNAFGITTAEDDTDGKTGDEKNKKQEVPEAQAPEKKNENALTAEDEKQIKEELLLLNTELEVMNYACQWESKYGKNLIVKGMYQKRVSTMDVSQRMTPAERKAWKKPTIKKS